MVGPLERIFNNIKSLGIKYYHKLPIRFKNVVKRGIFLKGNIYYLIFKLKSKFMFHSISNGPIKSINQFEYKIYSQNGEDGIIDMIFQKIDVTNRFCVEFGVGDGCIESNCLYLIKHKKWKYLFMDASDNLPSFVKKEFITAENINLLFKKYRIPKEFDLLSLDIDYNTYWVWKAISGYHPRVIVIEYNSSIPPTESKTVKYIPNVIWDGKTNYFGASLLALDSLGKSKGYTLVGCDSKGINAFFIRNDLTGSFVIKKSNELYKPSIYGRFVGGKYTGYPDSKNKFVLV